MSLSTISINRHALTWAISLGIFLLGLFGYKQVGLDRTPEVDFPVLVVFTTLKGATPETVAQVLTSPLESQLNTISGIESLESRSQKGASLITLNFKLNKPLSEAYSDVQSKVAAAARILPEEADTPLILKFDIGATPVAYLALHGKGVSPKELAANATLVKKKLESLDGVGEVRVNGAQDEQMQVIIQEQELNALGLTYGDIRRAFSANHLNVAGGTSKTQEGYFSTNLNAEFKTPQELGELVISYKNQTPVRLKQIAQIQIAAEDVRQFARFKGNQAVGLSVIKISGGNSLALVQSIQEKLPEISKTLPPNVTLELASDTTGPIEDLVKSLEAHLIEGTLLTAAVVLLFIRSFRATAIIAAAIPISLAGSVAAVYLLGYTLNSMTLLSLLLLIGVVVDDAIVVLENIVNKLEQDPDISVLEAAKKGADEVFFAVMASTLTLVAIFVPILFLPGILGRFFESLAAVFVVGVLVSWLVSLTLTPMLCSKYLKRHSELQRKSLLSKLGMKAGNFLEGGFSWLENKYSKSLNQVLKYKKTTIILAFASMLPAVQLMGDMPKGFSPESNEGRISVRVAVPSGATKEFLMQKMQEVAQTVEQIKEVKTYFYNFTDGGRNGGDSGNINVTLADGRDRAQVEILKELNEKLTAVSGVKARAAANTGMSGAGGRQGTLQFALLGPNYEQLTEKAKSLEKVLKQIDGMKSIDASLNDKDPQIDIEFDRLKMGQLGISAQEITDTIAAANGESVLGRYTGEDSERYSIVIKSNSRLRPSHPEELETLKIRSSAGLVTLSEIAKVKIRGVANSIERDSQQFAVNFSGTPEIPLGQAIEQVTAASESVLEPGYSIAYKGQSVELQKTSRNLSYVLIASLICLYLVLASQFNNFTQPLVVMAAQPLAVIGGIGALWLSGLGLNIYSMIGLILLMGLVAKNSILLVDRANSLVEHVKLDKRQAALEAGPDRLRPVLMTSLTLILALLPAALGYGAGAENNAPLSMAIMGGMISSTVLTLYVVPCIYCLNRPRLRFRKR